jgi:hypothetical protein
MTPQNPADAAGLTDTADPVSALDVICDLTLEPMFRLPDRRGTNSAWWGHVPFAAWLVKAVRPRSIVELGTFSGVSYAAFCQAVLSEGLDCTCHAVDTWQGDAHSGNYGEDIYQDFKRYHDAHYASISTVHRCTFDEAVSRFPDGSVDILHIDGMHTYEAVRHDFESWLPKLSPRGVVLFHDAAEHMGDFGVWRLWNEVSVRWPGFLFLHSHGLGLLVVGADVPPAMRVLCGMDANRIALLRERFGLLGDRWYAQAQWEVSVARAKEAETRKEEAVARTMAVETEKESAVARAIAAEAEKASALARASAAETEKAAAIAETTAAESEKAAALARAGVAETEKAVALAQAAAAQTEKASALTRASAAETEKAAAIARADTAETEAARLKDVEVWLQAIRTSSSWRVTAPLRSAASRFPGAGRQLRRGLRVIHRIAAIVSR